MPRDGALRLPLPLGFGLGVRRRKQRRRHHAAVEVRESPDRGGGVRGLVVAEQLLQRVGDLLRLAEVRRRQAPTEALQRVLQSIEPRDKEISRSHPTLAHLILLCWLRGEAAQFTERLRPLGL